MSYVSAYTEDEKNKQAGIAPLSQPGGIVATSTPSSGPSVGSASKGDAKATTGGTGWTNMQTYLAANNGAGDSMGNKINDNAQQSFKDGSGAATQWFGDSAKQVSDGTHIDNDLNLNSDISRLGQDRFNSWRNSSYDGPNSFTPNEAVTTSADKIKNIGTNAGSPEGRRELLKDTFKHDNYGSGLQSLDNTLLGGSASAMGQFQGMQDGATDFGKGLDTLGSNLTSRVGEARDNVAYKNNQRAGEITNSLGQHDRFIQMGIDRDNEHALDSHFSGVANSGDPRAGQRAAEAQKKALEDLIAGRR